MKSSPPHLVEFHDELGVMFYALGNCLFVLKGTQCLNMMTKKENEIDSKLIYVLEFKKPVNYLKISKNNLYVATYSHQIYLYDIDTFLINAYQNQQNLNEPLVQFDLVKYFKDSENGFIRQISTDIKNPKSQKFLITTSEQMLIEFISEKGLQIFPHKVRSAIYNQTGEYVICLPNLETEEQDHIFIYDTANYSSYESLIPVNKIKISLPSEVKRDYYKTYFMTEYSEKSKQPTIFIYSAFYENDSDKDDNIGKPLIFIIQEDINNKITFQEIKKTLKFYYQTDLQHQNDDDENSQIPIIRSLWLKDPKRQQKSSLCILLLNHSTQPFIFLGQPDGSFLQCDYQQLNNIPKITIPPPLGEEFGEMDSIDCLGACLGGFIMQTCIDDKFPGDGQQEFFVFGEGQDIYWEPPFITLYSLNGDFFTWQIFFKEYENRTCFLPIRQPIISQEDYRKKKAQIIKNMDNKKRDDYASQIQPQEIFTTDFPKEQIPGQIIENQTKEKEFQPFPFGLKIDQEYSQSRECVDNSKQIDKKTIQNNPIQNHGQQNQQQLVQQPTNTISQQKPSGNQQIVQQNTDLQKLLDEENNLQKIKQQPNQKLNPQQQKQIEKEQKEKQKQIDKEFLVILPQEIEKMKQEILTVEEQLKQIQIEIKQLNKEKNFQKDRNQDEEQKLKDLKLKESDKQSKLKDLENQLKLKDLDEKSKCDAEKNARLEDLLKQLGITDSQFNKLTQEYKEKFQSQFDIYRQNYQNLKVQQTFEKLELEKKQEQSFKKKKQRQEYIDQLFLAAVDFNLNKKIPKSIQQPSDLDHEDFPLFQLCILIQDEHLTEIYNEQIIKPLLYFKRQVAIDFQQLPIIDTNLVKKQSQIQIEAEIGNINQVVKSNYQDLSHLSKLFKQIKLNLAHGVSTKEKEFLIDKNLNIFEDSFQYMDWLIEQLTKSENNLLSVEQEENLQKLNEKLKKLKEKQNKLSKQAKKLLQIPQLISNQLLEFQTPEQLNGYFVFIQNYLQKVKQIKEQFQNITQLDLDRGTFIFSKGYQKQNEIENQEIFEEYNRLSSPIFTYEEIQVYQFSEQVIDLILAIETKFTTELLDNIQKKIDKIFINLNQPKGFSGYQIFKPPMMKRQAQNSRAYGIIDEDLEDDLDTQDEDQEDNQDSSDDSQPKQIQKYDRRQSIKQRIAQGFKYKKDQIVIRTEKVYKSNDQNKQMEEIINHFRDKTLLDFLNDKNQVNNIVDARVSPYWIEEQQKLTEKENQAFKNYLGLKVESHHQQTNPELIQQNVRVEEVKMSNNQIPQIQQRSQIEEEEEKQAPKVIASTISSIQPISQTNKLVQSTFHSPPQTQLPLPSLQVKQVIVQENSKQNVIQQNKMNEKTVLADKDKSKLEQSKLFSQDQQPKPENQPKITQLSSTFQGNSGGSVQPFQSEFGSLNLNSERVNFEPPKLPKENQLNQQQNKIFGQNFKFEANNNTVQILQQQNQPKFEPPQQNIIQSSQNIGFSQQQSSQSLQNISQAAPQSLFSSGQIFQTYQAFPSTQSQLQNPDHDPFLQNSSTTQGFNLGGSLTFGNNFNKQSTQNFGKPRK